MSLHVIVGAGPVGTATARLLAERGRPGPVVTRAGTGPVRPGRSSGSPPTPPTPTASTALDRRAPSPSTTAPTRRTTAGPPTGRRSPPRCSPPPSAPARCSPPSATSTATAPSTAPMTEDTPLAATGTKGGSATEMWRDALAAHRAGRVRVTEVRGSDYLGPTAPSLPMLVLAKPLLAGQRVVPAGRPGRPAQLDVHRRRRPHPGRRRHRRARLGPGLARAQRARRAASASWPPGGGPGRRPRAEADPDALPGCSGSAAWSTRSARELRETALPVRPALRARLDARPPTTLGVDTDPARRRAATTAETLAASRRTPAATGAGRCDRPGRGAAAARWRPERGDQHRDQGERRAQQGGRARVRGRRRQHQVQQRRPRRPARRWWPGRAAAPR